MIWEDECYLLSKRKFRENANIINIFTQKKGKLDGIVYGGTSRKIRNYLQISNKLFVSHTSKSENRIGYFKTELIKPISPLYFNDKERTSALLSICSLLNILLPDSQQDSPQVPLTFLALMQERCPVLIYVLPNECNIFLYQ